jgi:hypothetical protein
MLGECPLSASSAGRGARKKKSEKWRGQGIVSAQLHSPIRVEDITRQSRTPQKKDSRKKK